MQQQTTYDDALKAILSMNGDVVRDVARHAAYLQLLAAAHPGVAAYREAADEAAADLKEAQVRASGRWVRDYLDRAARAAKTRSMSMRRHPLPARRPPRRPAGRSSKGRVGRVAAGSSRRRSSSTARDSDSEPPAPAVAKCDGCGADFLASSRKVRRVRRGEAVYCTKTCAGNARQRLKRARDRGELLGAELHPGKPLTRVLEVAASEMTQARWRKLARHWDDLWPVVRDYADAREQVEAAASRRHALLSELPGANGNRAELVGELSALDRRIADGWEAVRAARAVVLARAAA